MMKQKPTLVVLAAGMGSRYGGLKQMAGLGPDGEVLLEYSVFDAIRAGFGKIVFIIRTDIRESFEKMVISRLPKNLEYDLVFQEMDALPAGFVVPEGRTKPWGTSHALWCARHAVNENFAVLNADDFYGESGFRKLELFFEKVAENPSGKFTGALVGYRLGKTLSESGSVARGICKDNADGYLMEIEEKTDIQKVHGRLMCDLESSNPLTLTGEELVSMNFWGFSPEIFKYLDAEIGPWMQQNGQDLKSEFLLPKTIGKLVSENQVRIEVLHSEDEWIGVTYANDKVPTQQKLAELSQNGRYPSPLTPKDQTIG
jgi:UTP-glucose-1-phosphate uridylyltransferase